MTDTRFDGYPIDDRFKTPGVDDRFPAPGTDTRFVTPGRDERFPDGGSGPSVWVSDWTIGENTAATLHGYGTGITGGSLVPNTYEGGSINTLRNRDETLANPNQMQLNVEGNIKVGDYDFLLMEVPDWPQGAVSFVLMWNESLTRYVWDHDQTFTDQIRANVGNTYQIEVSPHTGFDIIGNDDGDYTVIGGVGDWTVTISGRGAPYDGTYVIEDTADPNQVGWVVEPFVTGTQGTGNTRTVNPPIWFTEGSGTPSETNVIKRGASVIATDVALPYDYVQQAGDGNEGVTVEVDISNTHNTAQSVKEIVTEGASQVVVGSSTVTPTPLTDPDGDGQDYDLYVLGPADTITFSTGGTIPRALYVSPGGGGGISQYDGCGGGGGGWPEEVIDIAVTSTTYAVTGGLGGLGGTSTSHATSGEDITFIGVTVIGGAYGGFQSSDSAVIPPASGKACGGGGFRRPGGQAGSSGTLGGNGGSFFDGVSTPASSGGGGGAGADGSDAASEQTSLPDPVFSRGGNGLQSDITGTLEYYCGGGAGCVNQYTDPERPLGGLGGGGDGTNSWDANLGSGLPGVNGLGGGGGGGNSWNDDNTRVGGKGGDGAVYVRIPV